MRACALIVWRQVFICVWCGNHSRGCSCCACRQVCDAWLQHIASACLHKLPLVLPFPRIVVVVACMQPPPYLFAAAPHVFAAASRVCCCTSFAAAVIKNLFPRRLMAPKTARLRRSPLRVLRQLLQHIIVTIRIVKATVRTYNFYDMYIYTVTTYN